MHRFRPLLGSIALLLCCHAQAQGHEDALRSGWAAFESADPGRAYRVLLPLAEQGDKFAQFAVGEILLDGRGMPRDPARAIVDLRGAAEQEIPAAQERLGAVHYFGLTVPRDYTQAARWFERAARNG